MAAAKKITGIRNFSALACINFFIVQIYGKPAPPGKNKKVVLTFYVR
jgi:hypothetical protein